VAEPKVYLGGQPEQPKYFRYFPELFLWRKKDAKVTEACHVSGHYHRSRATLTLVKEATSYSRLSSWMLQSLVSSQTSQSVSLVSQSASLVSQSTTLRSVNIAAKGKPPSNVSQFTGQT
jgi:hypothetical protein